MKQIELLSDEELLALPVGSLFLFDIEVYPNFVLVAMKELTTNKHLLFVESETEKMNIAKLSYMVWHHCMIGFNSSNYDLPILTMLLNYRCTSEIKKASDNIILGGLTPWNFEKEYRVKIPNINHIDIIQVAPLQASLKLYGGRLHCPLIQDLPYNPHEPLSNIQKEKVTYYCCNDLETTRLLLIELWPHIELRQNLSREYGQDLRSLSDAQVAEAIVNIELHRALGYYPQKPKSKEGMLVKYNVPPFIKFNSAVLNYALQTIANANFVVQENGSCNMPKEVSSLLLNIGKSTYKMGIGGLHSTEKEVSYKATENTLILDKDVASYYPAIVLNQNLYPEHLGPAFLDIYRKLVDKRLAAKKAGNKKISEGLKIAINGIFGKFGNKYSTVYSPNLLLQVTLSGQLALLMLIEKIEQAGIPVASGNTDGIVILCPVSRYAELEAVVKLWEQETGFVTEETRYRELYSRDVNNYIAVKEDGSCKTKGVYCEKGSAQNSVLSKNPETLICSDAIQNLLTKNIPIEQTIKDCKDIRRFVSVRTVKGGAVKDGKYLGKAIRWYYAIGMVGAINYVESGNKVPKSDGAKPLMQLPERFPDDIDYRYYIKETEEMLYDIGYKQRSKSLNFF